LGILDFGLGSCGLWNSRIGNPKSKIRLALPLLVARVLADHADDILALHDAAGFAKPFDRCSYFHGLKFVVLRGQKIALESRIPRAIKAVSLLLPEGYSSFGQIVGRHF
jgi:hypothetical protein